MTTPRPPRIPITSAHFTSYFLIPIIPNHFFFAVIQYFHWGFLCVFFFKSTETVQQNTIMLCHIINFYFGLKYDKHVLGLVL